MKRGGKCKNTRVGLRRGGTCKLTDGPPRPPIGARLCLRPQLSLFNSTLVQCAVEPANVYEGLYFSLDNVC